MGEGGGRADVRDCEMLFCNIITSNVIMSSLHKN